MTIKNLLTVAAIALFALSANAQDQQRRQRRMMDPTEMFNRQADRLVKQMNLPDEKKDLFKVLYMDYQAQRYNAMNPQGEQNENIDMRNLTDEQAADLIEKRLAGQEAQAKVDRMFYAKFVELITPAQAAQIFLTRSGAMWQGRDGNGRMGNGRAGNGRMGGGPEGGRPGGEGFGGFGGDF